MIDSPGPDWISNEGFPPRKKGARVAVVLANGIRTGEAPLTATAPIGWLASEARWTIEGSPFDIAWYRIHGRG